MKGKIVGIIIISVLLVISCTCSIIGTVKHFKNDNTNLSDNKETNKTQEDNNNVESKEESKITEEGKQSDLESKNVIADTLPVFKDYKIVKVSETDFESKVKELGLVTSCDEDENNDDDDEYDEEEEESIECEMLLYDDNYEANGDNDYPNDQAYYDKKNGKIYMNYAFIDKINDNTIYLGYYNPKSQNDDDSSVRIDVLNVEEDKIVTVDLKAPVYGDNLSSHEASSYFDSTNNYIIYNCYDLMNYIARDRLLLDSKLNVIKNKFDNFNKNDEKLIIKKNNIISIYDNNLKILKEKEIKNVVELSETHALLNEKSSLKILSYQDIINDKNNNLDTGIKLEKKQSVYNFDSDNKEAIITIKDDSKSEKDIKKLCKEDYEYSLYGIEYKYNINSKKLSKKNECIPIS